MCDKISSGKVKESDAVAFANSICDAFKQAANEAGSDDFADKFKPLVEGRLEEDGVKAFASLYIDVNVVIRNQCSAGKITSAEQAVAAANTICDAFKISANEAGSDNFPDIFKAKIQHYL
jgi:hypothetical protein